MSVELYNEDCKETMKRIPDGSIDLMLTDIPYGTTACEWDVLPNLAEMWLEWERILKPYGTWIFTCTQPITSRLITSRVGFFKSEIIWVKNTVTGGIHSKNKVLKKHENIIVFSRGTTVHKSQSTKRMTYNPQGLKEIKPRIRKSIGSNVTMQKRESHKPTVQEIGNYPTSIIEIDSERGFHPTQKPVDLFRYLIRTYSNEGETVYDGYSGSGTTAIACIMEKRNFIGAEMNKEYYDKAMERIKIEQSQMMLF